MRGNFDDVVHVVALDLPGHARERNEVVGDDDDVVGIDGIGEREAERTAGGLVRASRRRCRKDPPWARR